ncbi:tRNA (N(6)-L-threonylcarbamoyladenosine(37)-C(2))-methylthiotransferase [Acidianus sulfidivorans JP7]|uniref:tRNA-t(6)A37 methylthiotransferase n=1 Tax=Acidianus sulfidivorans JP7 TaxID=619593 RepID=A0A2U9IKV2_9CREN|nr:tRNA (N(6)-L-threonylcarbamoyladenosine(37)-C(2))-methylthiotransferase [Acidianus sulfidivorans]AWR96662.1 tRNA (N(6)-L-threonylcarbamoyladenosine(37)-C(2))-methylthiotransferase [Acidianus sulfidivorans JP7]
MKVYFETYGCALNKGDTYIMMTLLQKRNHEIVSDAKNADVIVLNTCDVRLETGERMKSRIKELRKLGKKLVVAGCFAGAEPAVVKSIAPEASIIGPQALIKIVDAVENTNTIFSISPEKIEETPKIFEGKISIIPIADGCAGDCNFCITKLARKVLRSYSIRSVVNSVKEAVSRGAVEIELTGQDAAAYGLDLGGKIKLSDLLQEVLNVEGNFMVRIGMMTPEQFRRDIDGILDSLKHEKMYKFLHLPVQSGDDNVLKLMNRKYTIDEYKEMVKEARSKIPNINITTDIIIGHPGEDENAFQNTLDLMKELKFEKIHLAMYSIRPNTKSALMKQVPDYIKKQRMNIAYKLYEDLSLQQHREYLGKRMKILITEEGKNNSVIGRTTNYLPVVVPKSELGIWRDVEIIDYSFFDLKAVFV